MPTLVIPQYFTGVRLKNVKLTPLTVAVDGTFSKGSVSDLATSATVDEIVFDCEADLTEISGANAGMRNSVIIKDDFSVEITEIMGRNGSAFVLNGFFTANYFLSEVAISPDGGTTTTMLIQAVCVRSSLRAGPLTEGKTTMVLTGKACGLPIAFIPGGGTAIY